MKTAYKRTVCKKLKTLLNGKDIRVSCGDVYSQVRKNDFSSYYPEQDYISSAALPAENVFDIRDFGAVPNNENADNANAVNAAMEAAACVGGYVYVGGGVYMVTTVFLKSNVTLFIDCGSALCANKSGKGYSRNAMIYGENLENIAVTGGGKIIGMGNFFGRKPVKGENMIQPPEYVDIIETRRDYRAQLRFAHESKYGSVIVLKNCKNIKAHNFIIENSAYWTFRLDKCENVEIFDFVINNNRNVANADGIDMVGSSNVSIRHCFISTADDGIVLKNALWEGCDSTMQNIMISDCEIISRTNSIKIGTETTHNIENVCIDNCKLFMTDLFPGTVSAIAIEAVDGSVVKNIKIKNIVADRCQCPLFIRLGNRNRAAEVSAQSARAIEFGKSVKSKPCASKKRFNHKSGIENIVVKNFKATEAEIPIMICGYKQHGITKRVKNILLENIDVTNTERPYVFDKRLFIPEYAAEYPEANRFRNLPSYGFFIRHAENIKLNNCICRQNKTWKKEKYIKDLK